MLTHPLKVFINREDVYAKGYFSEATNKVGYNPEWKPITDKLIEQHITGEKIVGVYQLSEENMVKWICFDFDAHTPEEIEKKIQDAINLAQFLKDNGIVSLVEPSGSKGCHVWILLKTPITAKSAMIYGKEALSKATLEKNEIFPKQTSIGDGLGSLVKLPLGIHPKTKVRSTFINIDTKEPYSADDCRSMLEDSSYFNDLPELKNDREMENKNFKDFIRPTKKTDTKPCLALKEILDRGVGEGMRDDTRYVITAFAYNNGWSKEETLDTLLEFNKKCDPPDSEFNVKYKLEQNWKGLERSPKKVGCKSLGKFSAVLNEFCPYTDEEAKKNCEWINPYTKIEIRKLSPEKINNKRISVEGLMWNVKFYNRILSHTWECPHCHEQLTTTGQFPNDVPGAPTQCMNSCMANNVLIKLRRLRNSEVTEDGVIIKLTEPNTMPEKSTNIINLWCPVKDIKLLNLDDEQEKVKSLMADFGQNIVAKGRFIIERTQIGNKVKQVTYWLLAKELRRSHLSLRDIILSEADKEKFRTTFAELDADSSLTRDEAIKNLEATKVMTGNEFAGEQVEQEANRLAKEKVLKKIDNMLAPEVMGQAKLKRDILLTLFTPLEYQETYGVGRLMVVGDPDTGKSTVIKKLFDKYLKPLGGVMVTAEYMSKAGIGGGLSKADDGSWTIDWGLLPFCDAKALCIDGVQQLPKSFIASMREILETHEITIVKAAVGTHRAAGRIFAISNTNKYPIHKHYRTKYAASFDLGTGADWEQVDKLSGADRRRWHIIRVLSKQDVDTLSIDRHLATTAKLNTASTIDSELMQKFIAWAWSLRTADYDWNSLYELNDYILKTIEEFKLKYQNIDLAILGNKAYPIFVFYTLASAALHYRVNGEKVKPSLADVEFVKQMFSEMFEDLEADKELEFTKTETEIAKRIAESLDKETANIIIAMGENSSMSMDNVAKTASISKPTIYSRFRNEIMITLRQHTVRYSLWDGSLDPFIEIDPAVKLGKLTDLGKAIYSKIIEKSLEKQKDLTTVFK